MAIPPGSEASSAGFARRYEDYGVRVTRYSDVGGRDRHDFSEHSTHGAVPGRTDDVKLYRSHLLPWAARRDCPHSPLSK